MVNSEGLVYLIIVVICVGIPSAYVVKIGFTHRNKVLCSSLFVNLLCMGGCMATIGKTGSLNEAIGGWSLVLWFFTLLPLYIVLRRIGAANNSENSRYTNGREHLDSLVKKHIEPSESDSDGSGTVIDLGNLFKEMKGIMCLVVFIFGIYSVYWTGAKAISWIRSPSASSSKQSTRQPRQQGIFIATNYEYKGFYTTCKSLCGNYAQDINEYLRDGWRVKSSNSAIRAENSSCTCIGTEYIIER